MRGKVSPISKTTGNFLAAAAAAAVSNEFFDFSVVSAWAYATRENFSLGKCASIRCCFVAAAAWAKASLITQTIVAKDTQLHFHYLNRERESENAIRFVLLKPIREFVDFAFWMHNTRLCSSWWERKCRDFPHSLSPASEVRHSSICSDKMHCESVA